MRNLSYLFFGCGLTLISHTLPAFQWKNIFSYAWYQADKAFYAGQYSLAESLYKLIDNSEGAYNQGNALAYLADYSGAIAAYDRALAKDPQNKDAVFNRKIIMGLLKLSPPLKNKTLASKVHAKTPQKQHQKKPEKNIENQQLRNLIPDPTGSFLKEKFLRDYLSRR